MKIQDAAKIIIDIPGDADRLVKAAMMAKLTVVLPLAEDGAAMRNCGKCLLIKKICFFNDEGAKLQIKNNYLLEVKFENSQTPANIQ